MCQMLESKNNLKSDWFINPSIILDKVIFWHFHFVTFIQQFTKMRNLKGLTNLPLNSESEYCSDILKNGICSEGN